MSRPKACTGARNLPRRGVVQAGALSALGLSLADLFRLREAQAVGLPAGGAAPARAESVILIWLSGGPSHQDLWDLKPEAPAEVRGEFRPVETTLPGLRISELLPRTAKLARGYSLLRGITHNRPEHEGAHVWMLTGYKPIRPFFALRDPSQDQPSMGSVVSHQLGARTALPPYVCVPVASYNGAFQSFLPREHAPFEVNGDPSSDSFEVRDLGRLAGMDDRRMLRRRGLLERVDRPFQEFDRLVEGMAAKDAHYARAYEVVGTAKLRGAFDLRQEPAALRDTYGRNVLGQSVLLARRLVEHGARFVTIDTTYWGMYWDTHANNFQILRDGYGANLDHAYASLLEDLARRDLLDRTLVLLMSEFGRTPKINAQAGRDHWPQCNCALFAGAGVRAGQVLGGSDREAAYPEGSGYRPEDLVATIYTLLGIDTGREFHDRLGRPWPLATGTPIRELIAS